VRHCGVSAREGSKAHAIGCALPEGAAGGACLCLCVPCDRLSVQSGARAPSYERSYPEPDEPGRVAALFVASGGCYFGLPDVDPWDQARDARTYAGPWPVVAHPPCERWGRYWFGGPSAKVRRVKGDDGGCFAAALAAVRRWGGVLEHPESSAAWSAFDLNPPPWGGAWVSADFQGGWTCRVDQGNYGHRAKKATWLYACRVTRLPSLDWAPAEVAHRVDGCGFHTSEERKQKLGDMTRAEWLTARGVAVERMGRRERAATPELFRDLLLSIARGAS